MGASGSSCPRQDPAGREVPALGSVLILPREGGGGWTDMCVLVGSEGGSLEPDEYKETKRANKKLLLAPASGQGV